ncbi:MAG: hypothetical protein IJW53_03445 [Clostridia bacterium]|nr:hypothetical protein [Clostridia bacterium]
MALTKSEIILKIATFIVVLLIILAIVLLVLVLTGRDDFAVSPNNVIGGTKDEVIALGEQTETVNKTFKVENMFPGDSKTQTYKIEILDKEVEYITFLAEVASETAPLTNVTIITLTVDDATHPYFRGTVNDMDEQGIVIPVDGESMEFHVTVTLDTSAGNECQNGEIALNLSWGASGNEADDGRN